MNEGKNIADAVGTPAGMDNNDSICGSKRNILTIEDLARMSKIPLLFPLCVTCGCVKVVAENELINYLFPVRKDYP